MDKDKLDAWYWWLYALTEDERYKIVKREYDKSVTEQKE